MVARVININPVRNDNYNCFQAVIATLAAFWGRDCRLMFSDQWGFQYKEPTDINPHKIGERLRPGWKGKTKELLEIYHGIEVAWHSDIDHRYALQVLENELLFSRPIAVYMDAYLCPWTPAYNKYHTDHLFIVTGLNADNGSLTCVDPYYSDQVEYLSENIYQENFHKICTFSLGVPNSMSDWKALLLSCIPQPQTDIQTESQSAFVMMRLFADKVEQQLDIQFELEDYADMLGAPLLRQLKEIEIARYNFSNALEYIAHTFNTPVISMVATGIYQSGESWYKIRLMIMKLAYTPYRSTHLQKIALRIREVAAFEESLCLDLHAVCTK